METNNKDINKRNEENINRPFEDDLNAGEPDNRYETDGMGGPGGTLKTGNLAAGDMLMPSFNAGGFDRGAELDEDERNSNPSAATDDTL